MTSNIIASRYARALFKLGSEGGSNTLDVFASSLESLHKIFVESDQFRETMVAPIFTQEEKCAVITELAQKINLDPAILNFCILLSEKNRMGDFEAIVEAFQKQMDEAKGIVRGTLVTATPLDEAKQQSIIAELQKKTDHKLLLEFGVAKEILGGVILKVGDYVRDASLRTQLFILKDSIKRGE